MTSPAHILLEADNESPRPAWARFDAAWYLTRYDAAHAYCDGNLEDALAYYLEIGVQLGHSPSPLFDEPFYLRQNPDVHELVKDGKYRSGFDHFCQHGHRILSPHWLFDDAYYGRQHDDMTLENLDQHGFSGRYDHYLRSGQFERRSGHYIFDPNFSAIRALEAGASPADIAERGPYTNFLYSLRPDAPELRPSIYFEPRWYREQHSGICGEGTAFGSALEHYLRNDSPALYDPVPQFSEAHYRAVYRDVDHAIRQGEYRNGYQHFVQFGAFELRRPCPEIDLVYYRDTHARVQADLRAGTIRDAFAHLRLIGLPENLATAAPDALPLITEPVARQIFIRKARDNLALFARQKLDFATDAPQLAVIMVAFNKFELTMLALASLRANFAGGIELIIVDNASTDDTARIGDYLTGAKILRQSSNLGFLRAANRALPFVTAPALLYLNNDTELGHGAVAAALARLAKDPGIGAVCGKILRSHGALQEAGCIIWRDASTTGYLRDAPALSPAANVVRDVDFGSGVFLLCRTEPVKALGGFDEDFAPAYYEDADLCVRLRGAGWRLVYDPAVIVHHLEYGSAQNAEAAKALMTRAQKIFRRKHRAFLLGQPAPGVLSHAFAARPPRAGGQKPPARILFIEDTIPLRRLGSGFVRANDIVRAIAAAAHDVSVFPINGAPYDVMSLFGDFPETVEILHDQNINLLKTFLEERAGFYDLIWISRTHNLGRVAPILDAAGINIPPIVLDTEAIVAIRDTAFAILSRQGTGNSNFDAALREEFAAAARCAHITAVSRLEVDLLNALGMQNVSLLGTGRALSLTAPKFSARGGLLFVASIHRQDSPTLDALSWYMDAVLPALAQEMDEPPVLNLVGYIAPEIELMDFENRPGLKIHGPATDLTPFYETNRVFIAPTRFAAGTPYKLYEAAAHGIPIVATELLARQLGWIAGRELLTAPVTDPRRFAAQIALLYRTELLWNRLRDQAAARLAEENTPKNFAADVETILNAALTAAAAQTQPDGTLSTYMTAPASIPARRRAPRNPVPIGERLGNV
jgi:GT2 family glycosyltransferase/glycosyltransferase involved in cell wall biosynthesis